MAQKAGQNSPKAGQKELGGLGRATSKKQGSSAAMAPSHNNNNNNGSLETLLLINKNYTQQC